VLFGKYSGTEIKIEDEDYLILRETKSLPNFPARPRLRAARGNFPRSQSGAGPYLMKIQLKILRRRKTHGKANCDW